MDAGKERIALLWSTLRERALAKGCSFNMGMLRVRLQKNEAAWKGLEGSEKVR